MIIGATAVSCPSSPILDALDQFGCRPPPVRRRSRRSVGGVGLGARSAGASRRAAPVLAVLAVGVCAVLAGARTFAAIGEWARDPAGRGAGRARAWTACAVRVDDPPHLAGRGRRGSRPDCLGLAGRTLGDRGRGDDDAAAAGGRHRRQERPRHPRARRPRGTPARGVRPGQPGCAGPDHRRGARPTRSPRSRRWAGASISPALITADALCRRRHNALYHGVVCHAPFFNCTRCAGGLPAPQGLGGPPAGNSAQVGRSVPTR